MPTDVEENSYSSDVQSGVVTYIRSLCSNIQIASEKGLGDSDDNFLSSPSHPGVYASKPKTWHGLHWRTSERVLSSSGCF